MWMIDPLLGASTCTQHLRTDPAHRPVYARHNACAGHKETIASEWVLRFETKGEAKGRD